MQLVPARTPSEAPSRRPGVGRVGRWGGRLALRSTVVLLGSWLMLAPGDVGWGAGLAGQRAVPGLPQEPAAVVGAFHAALASGDRAGALALLAPELVVFEEGDREMSRDEYASEHLAGDLEFGRSTKMRLLDESSGESGDVAWVLRQTETTGTFGGKAVATRDTATFLLRRRVEGWRITHIHFSSHSVKPKR